MARRHVRRDIEAKGLDHTKAYSITYKGEFKQVDTQIHDAVHVSQPVAAHEPTVVDEQTSQIKSVSVDVVVVAKEETVHEKITEPAKPTEQSTVQPVIEKQKSDIEMNVAIVEGAVEKPQEQKSEKKSVGKLQKKKPELKTDVPPDES